MNGKNLNEIIYGNPVKYQSEILSSIGYLDTLYEPMQAFHFPGNSSKLAQDELNYVASFVRKTILDKKLLDEYLNIHFNMPKFFQNELASKGIFFDSELYEKITTEIDNLVLKIKYYYNRPRPYQLAAYYNLSLFPETINGIESPSYPSFSYICSLVFSHILMLSGINTVFLNSLNNKIFYSRLSLGFNYLSDMNFSKKIASEIIEHTVFKKKYEDKLNTL